MTVTRELRVVDASDPLEVLDALTDALSGDGPAILPSLPPSATTLPPSGTSLPPSDATLPPSGVGLPPSGTTTIASGSAPSVPHLPGRAPTAASVHRPQGRPLPAEVAQRIAVVVETSGSTGQPKRVALSADALLASAAASESALGGPGQWLLALPVNYIAGINVLVRSLAAQTNPVILPRGHFDPLEFCQLSATMDAELRHVSLVPAQLARLIDALDSDDSLLELVRRFDRILVGGQATPPHLVERSLELGLNVTRTYGSSETSGGCVYDGLPIGNTAVRIVDDQIELSGSVLAEGYLDDASATSLAFTEGSDGRWYRTGDTGVLVEGMLTVTGRLDSVIISGGIKVSLAAVEKIVRSLPGLGGAVVVAGKDDVWGEVPVVLSTRPVALSSIRDAVAAVLGKPAAPARVLVLAEIPLLASGKPDRVALAALVAKSAGNG